ncbi:hypothetical protein NQ314_003574 [Rhamnusium bicolor]|uniref:Uncharacterized protein n=1 Tax=Rhamnusium bicolor TaxID=1586634 RepID=A0AAV8ZPC2_9CUCU|nr:hypothetical protein NQ314_003574 [Rhamnusium bicolor]
MERKTILAFIVVFGNIIHIVENICNEETITSKTRQRICKRYYKCFIKYPIVAKHISCSDISIIESISNYDIEERNTTYLLTLKVTNSNISILQTSMFRRFTNLSKLYWDSNMQNIMPGAFNYLGNLKELCLQGNQLTSISDGLFNSLTSLEKLDLSNNRIQNISDHAFVGIKLNELHISNNNISHIEQALDPLNTLTTLDLSHNDLNKVTSFKNLPLRSLNLSHNRISEVDFELFHENLYEIDLSFNNISEITNYNVSQASEIILHHNKIQHFEENVNVTYLDLRYNKLETIGSRLFGSGLKRFYADDNSISVINPNAFFGLYDLEHLLLANNNLSSISNSLFKDLRSLTYLDLSGNKLTYFAFGTFDNLANLNVLNISNNNLKDLQQYTLHSLGNLTDLLFQNNEINEMHVGDLMIYMPKLKRVNLDNNDWSCKKLVGIVLNLKNMKVSFPNGNSWEESNIHGIKCHETFDRAPADNDAKSDSDLDYSKLKHFFNEDFTNTLMYKYFNEEFKNSNFFHILRKSN